MLEKSRDLRIVQRNNAEIKKTYNLVVGKVDLLFCFMFLQLYISNCNNEREI